MNRIKAFLKNTYGYFVAYLLVLTLCETILKLYVEKAAFVGGIVFVLFIPSMALFFTAVSGWFKKKTIMNTVLETVVIVILWLYYSVQIIYHGNFGSYFSVGLIKMGGEAAGNFWWAILSTIRKNALITVLMLLVCGAGPGIKFYRKKHGTHIGIINRSLLLVMAVIFWMAAVFSLKFMGTERGSAYYLLNNSYSDTDSSAETLGVLATTVVETGAYIFGINSDGLSNDLITVSNEDLMLHKPDTDNSKTGDDKTDSDRNNENCVSENDTVSTEIESEPAVLYHLDESIDFVKTKEQTENDSIDALCDYFSSKEPEEYNEYTGMLEGHNLIYICVESFSTQALNEKITPLLCEMAKNGFVFNNYYTSYMNTTTNGEFAFATGLWADVSRYAADGNDVGSFARSSDNYMPYGLGNLFAKEGVSTYAYHGYIGSYYRRCDSWPNLGYETIKFMNDGMTFINKYSPSDRELMEQSVDDYINDDRFLTYYMTFSGHGSYTTDTYMYLKNNEEVRALLEGDNYSDEQIAYYCGSYELEKAMEYLFERLETAGKLDNTLIVMASDHVPCSLSDEALDDFYTRQGLTFGNSFEMYHSTLIMYDKSVETPIVSDEYCCNVDVLPTVLNLLGINYDSRLLMGNDIFGDGVHRSRLYNGNFLTEYVRYNASRGTATWTSAADKLSEEEKQRYLNSMILYTENEYAASVKIVDEDFYGYLFNKQAY